ncbi:hypothetical protein JDT53_12540 [Escherichia coli]|nr:hypothetical protein [Escherichia coli]EJS6324268.1 hypothetical protein [Escherichia coli]EKM0761543.1 hypothetical protein [Escherichia coli]EKQ6353133.1 hypothetical protein [Escherichia coli]ELI4584680.1 hypothetical protein [Escherichia coli]
MKPTYEQLEQQLAESQREFRSADATIENLQMQVEKLAAENSGLRHLLDMVSETGNANFGRTTFQTPATEAVLAEVRAQGVDAAIAHLHKKFEGTGRIGVPVMALEWLAKELRQGGAA